VYEARRLEREMAFRRLRWQSTGHDLTDRTDLSLIRDGRGKRNRDLLRIVRKPKRSRTATGHGFHRPTQRMARGLLQDAGRSRSLRDPLRQSRLWSTHLDGVTVDLPAVVSAWENGGPMPPVPYSMSDFSDDAFGLLSFLGIERAHIVGASMGGMIVQTMAIEHPERVITMTSIMSTTGELAYYKWNPEARKALLTPPPPDRDAAIAHSVSVSEILSNNRYFDPVRAAERATTSYDRAFYPEGAIRQTAAIRGSGDRAEGLRNLRVPTLVIHGRADPLILPIGGERTAELVPGANLLLLHDMGHDMPMPLWPLIVDALVSHTTHAIG
jgi:pimeloyl-ACP methyl ester carboxylesterase